MCVRGYNLQAYDKLVSSGVNFFDTAEVYKNGKHMRKEREGKREGERKERKE